MIGSWVALAGAQEHGAPAASAPPAAVAPVPAVPAAPVAPVPGTSFPGTLPPLPPLPAVEGAPAPAADPSLPPAATVADPPAQPAAPLPVAPTAEAPLAPVDPHAAPTAPPAVVDPHAAAPAAGPHAAAPAHGEPAHGAATEHGAGGHEQKSELAIEHGSIFKPLAKKINDAAGLELVTGNHFVVWTVILLLIGLSAAATRQIRAGDPAAEEPRGLQNFFEMVVEALHGFCEQIIGPGGSKYAPLIGTFFLFILANNYIALIPGFIAPTSTLNLTLAMGLSAFGCVQYFAIKQNGLGRYLHHFAGSPKDLIGWILAPLMFVLELIGECVKPLSLSMRLFGNIFGEDTVIIQLSLLALSLGGWHIVHGHVEQAGAYWAAFIPLQLPMMMFALFGGLLQAAVFTMLTCIYISLLTSHDHEGHDHDLEHEHAAH
ncbi:MAG: F0F1 ATP synthase subunit A [Fimbriimonadaceae bacterium]|nr:F0F1 ATP synthase subunit A [Fimbriimonadaceae bacterium]